MTFSMSQMDFSHGIGYLEVGLHDFPSASIELYLCQDLTSMKSSPSAVLSLATNNLENPLSKTMPEGLKQVDPVQLPTFVLQKTSV